MSEKKAGKPASDRTYQRSKGGRTTEPADPRSWTVEDITDGDRSQRVANATLQGLPPELETMIVEDLVTNSPRETARNLKNFELVNKHSSELLARIPVLRYFNSTLDVAGRLAMDLHGRVYTKNGLENGLSTGDLIDTVGPVLKFQPPHIVSDVVGHVLAKSDPQDKADSIVALATWLGDLDPKDRSSLTEDVLGNSELDVKASSIAALAAQIHYLDPADRASLIDEAFKMFRQPGGMSYSKLAACDAIALAHDYLKREHWLELERSSLRPAISNSVSSIEQDREELNSTAGSGREPDMEELREAFESTSGDTTITELQRVERLGQIAASLSLGFIKARAELKNAARSREIHSR